MIVGYSGTPLPKKLGIRADSRVLVLNGPADLDLDLEVDQRAGREPYEVVLLFCPDLATLTWQFGDAATRHTTAGMIWVCWPKRSSGVPTDLTEQAVRDFGLNHGRVDVKVAAISEIWSGLKFVTRLADR